MNIPVTFSCASVKAGSIVSNVEVVLMIIVLWLLVVISETL